MVRLGLAAAIALTLMAPGTAQAFNPFGDNHVTGAAQRDSARARPSAPAALAPWGQDDDEDSQSPRARPMGPKLLDGGGRPDIEPQAPQTVSFPSGYAVGSVIIDTRGRQLFYVLSSSQAYRYPISVGREGFVWTGTETVSRKAPWPDWHPPKEMRERDPRLPEKMTGGVRNPLGAMAIYLGSTLYRIHGTNDARTIGQAASSGCFRMMNAHVLHLAQRIQVGAQVRVLHRLPADIARSVRSADSVVAVGKRS